MTPPRAADQAASRAAAEFARNLVADWQAALGSELLSDANIS
jgi:hypothetical protein